MNRSALTHFLLQRGGRSMSNTPPPPTTPGSSVARFGSCFPGGHEPESRATVLNPNIDCNPGKGDRQARRRLPAKALAASATLLMLPMPAWAQTASDQILPPPSNYQIAPSYNGSGNYAPPPLPTPAPTRGYAAPRSQYQPPPSPQPSYQGDAVYNDVPPPIYSAPGNVGTIAPPPAINAGPNFVPDPSFRESFGTNNLNPPVVPLPPVRQADLIVEGYPARTGRIMFGGAVNSDAGVTGQITIDERNFDITRFPTSFQDLFSGTAFRGAGQTFRLEAVPGNRFQRYTASFADPNLFGYLPISLSVSGFYYDRRFADWDEGRTGGRVALGYRVTPDLSISGGVSGQNVEISNPRVRGVQQLERVLGDNELYAGSLALTHDTRNSPLQPSDGHYIKLNYEQTFGDFDYPRLEAEYRTYALLRQRADRSGKQTLSYSLNLGFSGDDTPIFENYFAGGYATIRGFDFRGASPVDSGVEVGGRFQFLNSVEYTFPITADDAFKGVAFVDFGTVESDIEINSENFRVAPGFGFRVAIPALGPAPLAFDFAFPVAMAEFDDERVFSFYMSAVR